MKVYLNDEKKSVDPWLHLKRVGIISRDHCELCCVVHKNITTGNSHIYSSTISGTWKKTYYVKFVLVEYVVGFALDKQSIKKVGKEGVCYRLNSTSTNLLLIRFHKTYMSKVCTSEIRICGDRTSGRPLIVLVLCMKRTEIKKFYSSLSRLCL